jgi:hypothetical protein
MSTVYNLVSLYKTDIMTESATREFLIDVLRKAFPNSNIYTGQKRVVITDPTTPTMVYKIAYNNAGILDNINELATTDCLKGLVTSGKVPQDVLNCFALSVLTPDNDPFIIMQEFVQNFDDNQDFRTWLNNSDVIRDFSIVGSINNNQVFPIYCSRIPRYVEDYKIICDIMTNNFIPSDISIYKEPRNYGFKNGRLCLLDMGSVVPILCNDQGQPLYPRYGTSNEVMTYVASYLDPNLTISKIQQMNPGTYRVVRNNYSYGNAVNESPFLMESDDAVHELYIKHQNPYEYNKLLAMFGRWYFPQVNVNNQGVATTVNNLNEYAQSLMQFLGFQVPEHILISMWRNYIYKKSATYITVCPKVISFGVYQQTPQGIMKIPFSQYVDIINAEYVNNGVNLPKNILFNLSSILYIKQLALTTQDPATVLYNLYHSSPDQFIQFFSQLTGDQNTNDIFLLYNSSVGNV